MTDESEKNEKFGGKPYGEIVCPFWTDSKIMEKANFDANHPSVCSKCWNKYDYSCYYPKFFDCDQYEEMLKTIDPKYLKSLINIMRTGTDFIFIISTDKKTEKTDDDMPICSECNSNNAVKIDNNDGYYFCSTCENEFYIGGKKFTCPDCGISSNARVHGEKEVYYCLSCESSFYTKKPSTIDKARNIGTLEYNGVYINVLTYEKGKSISFSIGDGTKHDIAIIINEDEEF